MQSLWTKAGQAHRCGCRACSTAIGAAGRRATGATGRRKATFAEIFTACYSSVFATAAIVDAVRKDDRRRELDRQLEEARRELGELQERSSSTSSQTEANAPDLSIQQMDTLWKSLKAIYRNRPFMKEIDKPAVIDASELIANLKKEYYNAVGEPSLHSSRQINYDQLERAIKAEERDSRIGSRESLNQVHLLRESHSVEYLVQQLLHRAEMLDKSSAECPSFDEARGLAAKGYPNFLFRSVDPDKAAKNTVALNNQIRSLVKTHDLSWKEKIGRVCFNLLVSAYPPDMHTYNTLIVAFDRSGHHGFSDALVYSFFHRRLLKPTPSTFTAILNHYRVARNHGQFLRTLACLTGIDRKSGGKMGRRHIKDVESWGMEKWAANTKLRTSTGNWVWEHVPLNVLLVETILNGLLHFKLFDEAASFFVSCMRSGVALSTSVVKQLFDECVAALDWRAAVRLIRGLSDSQKRWEILLSQEDADTTAHLVGRAFALIDICGLSTHREREGRLINLDISGPRLNRLLESLSKANLSPDILVHPGSFEVARTKEGAEMTLSKSRLLQLESIWKEYEFVRKTTNSIESKLLYPEFSSTFRTSMAIHISKSAIQRSVILAREVQDVVPASGSLSLQSPRAAHNEQPSEEDRLSEEMQAMAVNDGWTEQQGGPKLREAQTAARGWSRTQDGLVAEHVCFKPRALLTWQRPSHRVYAEGRQWAVGT
ncbi:hypothetical protein J3459_008495 [Metarhizium acridum]|uniref:Pentatricopeptide repeat domain-containing protein n=1 Tax=Metarhizium acridum (strain CQMa 102) TaxID=655827 RepID=E9DS09_METAQ|nr:uncharacterized protein MAC_00082 [Metarhizium acridum CQMa 102]EFY93591.1 hypothetical protein MAC_00082 [Metarhizium acridum CQMa 102]KAG8426029.1 hypothetical protein J3459_008495 [Metarhizium acridum]